MHRLILAALLTAALLVGCESEAPPEEYVARVGSYTLTKAELDSALQGFTGLSDTSEARRQIVEQWVTRTLLLREALRTNLDQEPEVKRRIEEQRRSVLVSALTNRLYEEAEMQPSESEIRDYFARHREQLRLREPYVRIRHLAAANADSAAAARQALRAADAVSDSLWSAVLRRHSTDPERARAMADRYFPESRLFARLPYVRDELPELQEGEVSRVVRDDSLYHVLQVVERIPAGTPPEVEWVEPQIRRRLRSRARKQMYAREVQRLRNEAKAQNELDVR
jgi:parvulin-like peptidyl-prolyl isomerase